VSLGRQLQDPLSEVSPGADVALGGVYLPYTCWGEPTPGADVGTGASPVPVQVAAIYSETEDSQLNLVKLHRLQVRAAQRRRELSNVPSGDSES
jgi:hypothetical protein